MACPIETLIWPRQAIALYLRSHLCHNGNRQTQAYIPRRRRSRHEKISHYRKNLVRLLFSGQHASGNFKDTRYSPEPKKRPLTINECFRQQE